jgi:D-alanine-D-alanine ligase
MEFYSYAAKYVDDSTELRIPAPLDDETIRTAKDIAVRVYQAIDCAGLARVDFLLDRDSGILFVNEVNTIPGFTSISMYPKLWNFDGISYPELVDRLVSLALERKAENDLTVRTYGSKA